MLLGHSEQACGDSRQEFFTLASPHPFKPREAPTRQNCPFPKMTDLGTYRGAVTPPFCPTSRSLLNIWALSRQMFGLLQEHKQLVFIHLVPASPLEKDPPPGGAEPASGRGGEGKRRKPVPLQAQDLLGSRAEDGSVWEVGLEEHC